MSYWPISGEGARARSKQKNRGLEGLQLGCGNLLYQAQKSVLQQGACRSTDVVEVQEAGPGNN